MLEEALQSDGSDSEESDGEEDEEEDEDPMEEDAVEATSTPASAAAAVPQGPSAIRKKIPRNSTGHVKRPAKAKNRKKKRGKKN